MAATNMSQERQGHTATLLLNGYFVVMGRAIAGPEGADRGKPQRRGKLGLRGALDSHRSIARRSRSYFRETKPIDQCRFQHLCGT